MRALAFGLLLSGLCLADRVVLHSGAELFGVVELRGDSVLVYSHAAPRSVHHREVRSLSYGLTPSERLAARLAHNEQLPPEVLRALAGWARTQGLPEALELEHWARELELEQRLAEANTAECLYEVALWARAQGFSAGRVALCDQLVFARDVDFFALRRLRDEVFFAGDWMPRARTAELARNLRLAAGGGADAASLLELIEGARSQSFRLDPDRLARLRAALPPLGTPGQSCYGIFESPRPDRLARILSINDR